MKYLKQFLIILIISFVGELLHAFLPLPVPASIYGIVIMFCLLEFRIIPLSAVREAGKFLIEIMPVMFIPAAVGLLNSWSVIKPSWIQYLLVTLLSTVVVMAVAGLVTQGMIRYSNRNAGKNGKAKRKGGR